MRIASLLPSATEIVCALGLEEDLIAVTHECDFPAGIGGKPIVTSSLLGPGLTGREVDRHIRRLVHEGSSIYRLDAERLNGLHPDLILTQELCPVCAVSYPVVEAAARRSSGAHTQLVSLEPESLEDVFDQILLIGRLAGKEGEAASLVDHLRQRLASLTRLLDQRIERTVVFLEWVDPLFGCGHWTPQLVELAGGRELLGSLGRPARTLGWEELIRADPDVIVIAACGYPLERNLAEAHALRKLPGWDQLTAVGNDSVFVVDGNAYFSRPGPRLIDSVEILAGLLHPEVCAQPSKAAALRLSLPVEKAGSSRHD